MVSYDDNKYDEFRNRLVLILIVVDDGLVLTSEDGREFKILSLNPYCSGRWSRTYLTKL